MKNHLDINVVDINDMRYSNFPKMYII